MSRALAIAAAHNRTNKENVPAAQPIALCDIRRHSGLFKAQKGATKGTRVKSVLSESALSPQPRNSPGDTGDAWIVDAQLDAVRKEMAELEQQKAALAQEVLASRQRIEKLELERVASDSERADCSAAAQREVERARSQHALALAKAAAQSSDRLRQCVTERDAAEARASRAEAGQNDLRTALALAQEE